MEDLIIQARGTSKIAAQYGMFFMKQLHIFNTIKITIPEEINEHIIKNLKYGGLLTVTQQGHDLMEIEKLKLAYRNNLTCFNVVNTESSPITKAIDEVQEELRLEEAKDHKP